MRRNASCIAVVLVILLGLAGCATAPTRPEQARAQDQDQTRPIIARAQRLANDGRVLAAARLYRDRIEQTSGATAQRWRLRLTELLFAHGYPELAAAWQRRLDARPVPEGLRLRKRIVDAQAAIARHRGVRALRLLPRTTTDMPAELRARILATRADAVALTGRAKRALALRVQRERLLQDPAAIEANHRAIWGLLQGLPGNRLQHIAQTARGRSVRGWAKLALAVRRARMADRPIREVLADWRHRFRDHPATERFVARLRQRVVQQLSYPDKVALLLPLSGRLAEAGRAIRNGFMAAYFDQPEFVDRPVVEIYDTASRDAGAVAAYEQAVKEGADLVIGPLAKSAVAEIAARDHLEVPVLSLNYLPADAPPPPAKMYQFGLLPEDEARQVAEAAIQNGHYTAVALTPAGQWGARMLEAFRERFRELGGVLLEASRYNGMASDYSRAIRNLFNLPRSEHRASLVRATIDRPIHFEPRRRQDVEVVFFAGMPRQARLIEPQLEFHRAGQLPAYSTSHIYTGHPQPNSDWDLNGVFFTEIPWLLKNLKHPSDLYRTIQQYWPRNSKHFPRLYALGMDAFTVIPHLERLDKRAYAALHGRTGRLTMDANGRIHRQLRWATFIGGRPVPVPRPESQPIPETPLGADVRKRAGSEGW